MQTDAVDWEALSTPLFNIEAKGVNNNVVYVSVSNGGFSAYIPNTYLPKSIKTLAHACWTVPDTSVKYA